MATDVVSTVIHAVLYAAGMRQKEREGEARYTFRIMMRKWGQMSRYTLLDTHPNNTSTKSYTRNLFSLVY